MIERRGLVGEIEVPISDLWFWGVSEDPGAV